MKPDLTTQYLGLDLANPLIASSCPLTGDLEMLRKLESCGAAAVVLPSVFEEQVEHQERKIDELYEFGAESIHEAMNYFPELDSYNTGLTAYLELIRRAKSSLKIPVIASLCGYTPGGWVQFARAIEEAGADALELNMHFVTSDPEITGATVEQRYVFLVERMRQEVTIPIAVKIGPWFSSLANMASQLVRVGANGIIVFNRYPQPDINLDTLQVCPELELTTPAELRLPLRWIALLEGRIKTSLAATTGIHTWQDLTKVLLAGADAAMIASAFIKNGPEVFGTMVDQLSTWLEEHEYTSLTEMKGTLSESHCPDTAICERSNYREAITGTKTRWM